MINEVELTYLLISILVLLALALFLGCDARRRGAR